LKKIILLLFVISSFSCSNKKEIKYVEEIRYKDEIRYVEKIKYVDEFVIPTDFSPPMTDYKISSKFGFRTHPLGGEEFDLHKGVDLVGPKDAKVMAAKEGVVAIHFPPPNGHFKGHSIYGGLIIINHQNGVFTLYGHLKSTYVREGQKIKKGEMIGIQGSTGISTGPHLHFEIVVDPVIALKEKK